MRDLTPRPPLRCGEGEPDLPPGAVPPFPPREGGSGGVGLVLLALALIAHCQCNHHPADADTNADGEADVVADSDIDIDIVGDLDDEEDEEPDAEEPELCRGAGPVWSWPPCSDEPTPPDCCPACRRLTCRESVATAIGFAGIWGDLVAFGYRTNVAMVDLRTGEDQLVFESWRDGEYSISYSMASISSQYVVVRRLRTRVDHEGDSMKAIVARRLDDLSGPEIIVDDSHPDADIALYQAHEEWALWIRTPPATGWNELVLHNIETGEERILDQARSGHGIRGPGMWGDRVVWGQRDEIKGETLVEHRISTNTTLDVLTDPSLEPMYMTSVWENYAVFNHQPHVSDWNAMLVDLDTGEVRQITPSGSNQDQARIQGGRVVWTDYRDSDPHYPGGSHIFIYSLSSGREYILNPSCLGGSSPLIFDRNIVWGADQATGVGGVFVTRIGDI
jgi:beta propeller repeat protein